MNHSKQFLFSHGSAGENPDDLFGRAGLEGESPSQKRPKLILAFNIYYQYTASNYVFFRINKTQVKLAGAQNKRGCSNWQTSFTGSLEDVQMKYLHMKYLQTEIRGIQLEKIPANRFVALVQQKV